MRYREISIPDEDIQIWGRLKGLIIKRRQIIHASAPRAKEAVALAHRLGYEKKCVMFAMDIETCERMYGMLQGGPNVYRVHSKLKDEEIAYALDSFKKIKSGILIAPKMLDEGIDVPDAEIGINVASSKTKLQLVQRMGRILRKKPGKKPECYHFFALPQTFVEAEDSFRYINDLAWIDDVALKMGLNIESYDEGNDDVEIQRLEESSEKIVRNYYHSSGESGIVAGDFGTIKIKNILSSITTEAKDRLIGLLEQRRSTLPIRDDEWLDLLRLAYNEEGIVNLSSQRWLLIIADRNADNLLQMLWNTQQTN